MQLNLYNNNMQKQQVKSKRRKKQKGEKWTQSNPTLYLIQPKIL
jgi:hypothetical protein